MVSTERRKQIKARMAEITIEMAGYVAELAEDDGDDGDDDPLPRDTQAERPRCRRHRRWLHPVR